MSSSLSWKDSGVKRLIVIGIAPSVQENHENLVQLWRAIGLDRFAEKFTIAGDLKIANLLCGLMAHSSAHPCCWCDASKNSLHTQGHVRTLAGLHADFEAFGRSHGRSIDARNCNNVVRQPIELCRDLSTPILQVLPPPELHLLTGPVNTLFNALQNEWPDCMEWAAACHVMREALHGGCFTGNSSRTLLKRVVLLAAMAPPHCWPFIEAFKCFGDVVAACYGDSLQPNFEETIGRFQRAYLQLNISVTPKVHAVFFHVAEFCSSTQCGLGPWSEQAVEAAHSDFNGVWRNFEVKDLHHPEYGTRLLRAVRVYNSRHV